MARDNMDVEGLYCGIANIKLKYSSWYRSNNITEYYKFDQ